MLGRASLRRRWGLALSEARVEMGHTVARSARGRAAFARVRRAAPLGPLVVALLLAGCTTARQGDTGDPFEQTNRSTYNFNDRFNNNVTLPIAWVYVNCVPGRVRKGMHNVLSNVGSPVTFANDVLQGELSRAGETLARFLVNSTVGLGGLFDVGAMHSLPRHVSDFGQTLAVYGVGSGPFLVLPIIGPSTPRDIVGTGVDLIADPLLYVPADWPLLARVGAVVGIHSVLPLEKNAGSIVLRRQLGQGSVDPYATMRSVYRQQRAREIQGGILVPDRDD